MNDIDKWDARHGVHWDGGHIKFFSERTLRDLVGRRGVVDIRFVFYRRAPSLWKNTICVAKKEKHLNAHQDYTADSHL